MKIIAVSDNHGNEMVLKKILQDHPNADYYFHLGDSEMDIKELRPFCSVRGNVDFDYELPSEKIVDLKNHRFLLTHGNIYSGDPNLIVNSARQQGCDVALFGHTHRFLDKTINGIRIINPGSCRHSKDMTPASYAVITINDRDLISVERVNIL